MGVVNIDDPVPQVYKTNDFEYNLMFPIYYFCILLYDYWLLFNTSLPRCKIMGNVPIIIIISMLPLKIVGSFVKTEIFEVKTTIFLYDLECFRFNKR